MQNLQDFFASVHISSIFACICIWKGSWGGGVRFRVRPGLRPNPFLRKWNWSLSSWATASCLNSRVLHICAWAACETKSRSIPISHICTEIFLLLPLLSLPILRELFVDFTFPSDSLCFFSLVESQPTLRDAAGFKAHLLRTTEIHTIHTLNYVYNAMCVLGALEFPCIWVFFFLCRNKEGGEEKNTSHLILKHLLTILFSPNRAARRKQHRQRVSTTLERNSLLWGTEQHNRAGAG